MNSTPAIQTSLALKPENPGRFHSMDALRGFALLLGVVFHAAESFCPGRYSWAIVDVNAHWLFDWFQSASHSFRMELFFLIAGFFAHLVLSRRGGSAFIRNRFNRIVLPMLAGWFLFYPIFVCIWIWGASTGGRLDAFGVPAEFHSMPAWKLTIGLFMETNFVMEEFSLLHLWFLHQLVIIYAAVLSLRFALKKVLGVRTYGNIMRVVDSQFMSTASSTWKWLIFPALTVPVLFLMKGWGVDTPNDSLIPHLPTSLLYGGFFLFGWLLHRQGDLLAQSATGCRWLLALLTGFILTWITKFYGPLNGYFDPENALAAWDKVIYLSLYAVMMWCFVLGFIGLFTRFANTGSECWRYIADSSYWIYLVHHMVVVPVQILFANLYWPAGLKFILINAICFPVLYLSYHYMVRYTWLGGWLNGRKHKRVLDAGTTAVAVAYR